MCGPDGEAVIRRRPRVVWGPVLRPDAAYVIRKLRYEIFPDYWIPALLYEPTRLRGRVGVVLNPNGHHTGGKAAIYKQARCINLAKRGLIALNFEFIGMGELGGDHPHNNLAVLDMTGMSCAGAFYLGMRKGLDVLLSHPRADRKRVAMTGLSGGGWQTIVLSALDSRITLSVPVAGYTSLMVRAARLCDIGDIEQLPPDLATVLDYQDMTAMLAPRPTLQTYNAKDDCCFESGYALKPLTDAAAGAFASFDKRDSLRTHV
ncbi:hypothetical protein LCGC14_2295910, partial [marine sediment metagenome]